MTKKERIAALEARVAALEEKLKDGRSLADVEKLLNEIAQPVEPPSLEHIKFLIPRFRP